MLKILLNIYIKYNIVTNIVNNKLYMKYDMINDDNYI